MTEAKTGRHPLDQIRRAIRQKLLTPIRLDDPLAGSRLGRCGQSQKLADPLIHLIVRIPLHRRQRTKPLGQKIGPETDDQREISEKEKGADDGTLFG
jgi:hypothetical protein